MSENKPMRDHDEPLDLETEGGPKSTLSPPPVEGSNALATSSPQTSKPGNLSSVALRKMNNFAVTAIIPAKKNSVRCPKKNVTRFSNSCLLALKIKQLLACKNLDRIIVSTDDDEAVDIALELGVAIHYRTDDQIRHADIDNSYFQVMLADQVKTNVMMYVHCVAPFFDTKDYEECIDFFLNSYGEDCDSVASFMSFREYLWADGKPMNYDTTKTVLSQNLPEYFVPSFACCISRTQDVIKNRYVIGKKCKMYASDRVKSIDIDYPWEFLLAELLEHRAIGSEQDAEAVIRRRANVKRVLLLDCTIRDGGFTTEWHFSDEQVAGCYRAASQAGFDYFEIGFRTNRQALLGKGKWCYCDEVDIGTIISKTSVLCKIAVMIKVGSVTLKDFVPKTESYVDMVRIYVPYCTMYGPRKVTELNVMHIEEARALADGLVAMGYEVALNLGSGDYYSPRDFQTVAAHFHDCHLHSIYLADTCGGFTERTIHSQFAVLSKCLLNYGSTLPYGFHAHDNNCNGVAKAIAAINSGASIVDSCIAGLGRGAGNAKSELLVPELFYQEFQRQDLDVLPILQHLEDFFPNELIPRGENGYGYHPLYAIAGHLSTHPDYVAQILKQKMTVASAYALLLRLDNHTRRRRTRNYDKTLIARLLESA